MKYNPSAAGLAVGWIEAWIRMDMDWLRKHLATGFVHVSPFGRLEGRDLYLETVEPLARKSVQKLTVRELIASENQAAIWFDNQTGEGAVPSCDWIRAEKGLILEIRSFYDTAIVRQVLSKSEQAELVGDNLSGSVRANPPAVQSWPIIAVSDVVVSTSWYMTLLDAQENHPGATVFNQILSGNGTVLLCLHHWGPSGPNGDHTWPSLNSPEDGRAENGLLLWFVVSDFDAAWLRVQNLEASVSESPNRDNGTGMRAFVVRDPDGYYVTINEAEP